MPISIKSWRICSIQGIPINVDITFAALVCFCMIANRSIIAGIVSAALVGLSIVAHELGHSMSALAFGFKTRSITLSVLGGCAMLEDIPRVPLQEILVAIAGPAISFFFGISGIVLAHAIGEGGAVGSLSSSFGWLNLILGVFNLLPGFPMDGGRVLRAALSHFLKNRSKATWWAMKVGKGIALVFGGLGALLLLTGQINGVTLPLIAWFIWKASEQEYLNSLYRP